MKLTPNYFINYVLEVNPVTSAPYALAIWTAAVPTAPEAP